MKTYYVVAAIGRERPGVVNKIAHEVTTAGGNIESQQGQIMAGDFASLMLVSVDPDVVDHDTMLELSSMRTDELAILVRKAHEVEEVPEDSQYAELIISGEDQRGLIDGITVYLLRRNIDIARMQDEVVAAPMTGTAYLNLRAVLIVPGTVKLPDLQADLDDMERNLGVDHVLRILTGPDDIAW